MLTLGRESFLNQLLDGDDLRALAEIWRACYVLHPAHRRPAPPAGRLAARAWAYPRSDAPTLRDGLDAATGATPVAHDDCLDLLGPADSFDPSWWARLLDCPDVGRACLLLSVTLADPYDPAAAHTLALAGQAVRGQFLLKAMWATDSVDPAPGAYMYAAWEDQRALLAALETYRGVLRDHAPGQLVPPVLTRPTADEARRVAAAIATLTGGASAARADRTTVWPDRATAPVIAAACAHATYHTRRGQAPLPGPGGRRVVDFLIDLTFELPGRHGVRPFLRRLATFAAVVLVGLAVTSLSIPAGLMIACLGAGGILRNLYDKARKVVRLKRAMTRSLTALLQRPAAYERLDPATSGFDDHPTGHKFTADLRAAGATHEFDYQTHANKNSASISRLFTLPDGVTQAQLALLTASRSIQIFPPRPVLLLTTRFTDGHRLVTGVNGGYRRRIDPAVTHYVYRGEDDLSFLLERHAANLTREIAAGRTPLAADPDAFIARAPVEFERQRTLYAGRSVYTWGDALHQAFDVVRREYHDDAAGARQRPRNADALAPAAG